MKPAYNRNMASAGSLAGSHAAPFPKTGVGATGFQVGYSSDSAFVYACRRAFGISPEAFYNQSTN